MGQRKNLPGVILITMLFLLPTERSAAQPSPLATTAHQVYLSNPDSAMSIARQALDIAVSMNDAYNEAYCYLILAKCYWVKANYRLSTELGFKALKFFEGSEFLNEHSMCLLLLGRTFLEHGDLQKGNAFIHQALRLGIKHQVTKIQAEAYREKSYFCLESDELDSALFFSNKSLAIFKALGDSLEISVLTGRKSKIYFRKKKFSESRYFAYQSLLIDSLVNNQRGLGISHYLVAKNENAFGNKEKAVSHLNASIRINEKIGNVPWLIKAHDLLASIRLNAGKPDMAAIEFQKAGELKDSLYNSRLSGQIQQMNALYDLATKEGRIRLLERENQVKLQQVESQQLIISFAIIGIVLLTSFLLLLARLRTIQNIAYRNRAKHLRELDDLKTRFFTNISHEFRTPITLILGPLKELHDQSTCEPEKSILASVVRNAQRLLRLINQLLDLSKIEAGKMQLHCASVELVEFSREVVASYESLAATKQIHYTFSPEVTELHVQIDREKMENVIHNLLSNAFKFTRSGDRVTVSIARDNCCCVIKVADSGIGISADQIDKIFDRFYQVDSSHTRSYEGSGLGMALAKDLVELHRGIISVNSVEGEGTTFTVRLPLSGSQSEPFEVVQNFQIESRPSPDTVIPAHEPDKKIPSKTHEPVLLIVEDNIDMRHYIRKILSTKYDVIEAENGITGMHKALESLPDLIISDIMMPGMDGYKLCKLIKTHELTSHIPVILLTAKADRESKLSGLETHAEDYLPKPFDPDELRLIVRNRIDERKKMRDRLIRHMLLEPAELPVASQDEKFLNTVMAIIEKRMDDEHFSIDELAREAGLSHMHLYRKIKALCGQSPSDLLRSIRLRRAAHLLSKNTDHVTQIAYSVGFGSVSYFTKCFKNQFGVSPRSFRSTSLAQK